MADRRRDRRVRLRALLPAAVLGLSIVACGESDADEIDMRVDDDVAMDTTPAGTPAPPTLPSLMEDAERHVRLTLSEWAVALNRSQLPDGEITLQITNAGIEPHALAVEGPEGVSARTEPIEPGEVRAWSVELEPGTYRLFCPDSVGGGAHADRGMSTPLVVR